MFIITSYMYKCELVVSIAKNPNFICMVKCDVLLVNINHIQSIHTKKIGFAYRRIEL